jgi:hypothetical protein
MKFHCIYIVPIILLILVFFGCTPANPYDTVPVKGTVLVDGKPLQGIIVTFLPFTGEGQAAGGITNANGHFTLTLGGAPVGSGTLEGKYNVTFSKIELEEQKMGQAGLPKITHLIPERYSDPKTSGIEPVIVEKKIKNEFNFKLSFQ